MPTENMAAVEAQFPGSPEALAALAGVVAVYRREMEVDATGLELEARFGSAAGDAFTTGVQATVVDRVMSLVQSNPTLHVGDWYELEDFFFDVDGAERRSRSCFNTDELCVEAQVITKTRLAECRLRSGTVAVRIVVSRETDVEHHGLDLIDPKHVRIQQRRRVAFSSRCASGAAVPHAWAIDVGMVWSGGTKEEAEQRQMGAECPQYTLEVELLDPAYVRRHSDAYVACSVAMKAADLVDPTLRFHLARPAVFLSR